MDVFNARRGRAIIVPPESIERLNFVARSEFS